MTFASHFVSCARARLHGCGCDHAGAGLTVNATIFFMINDLFLRPLPAADPGRLVVIAQTTTQSQIIFPFSYPDFLTFSALRGRQP